MKLGALGIPPYRTFSLVELEAATDNFENSLLLGQDSFGEVCQSSPLISSDSIEQEILWSLSKLKFRYSRYLAPEVIKFTIQNVVSLSTFLRMVKLPIEQPTTN